MSHLVKFEMLLSIIIYQTELHLTQKMLLA